MTSTHSVSDYVVPATGVVHPGDPLHLVRNLMGVRKLSTVIVAHDNRPVGVVRWDDITQGDAGPDTSLTRDIMVEDCPVLTENTSSSTVCSSLEASGLDQLPVVNNAGKIIGIVPRETLGEAMCTDERDGNSEHYDQPTTGQIRRAFNVRPGMNVYSSDRRKLGLVDRMFLEHGRVTGFLVTHGLLGRRHKQLQFDVVDHLEDETIILGVDQTTFLQIPDVGPRGPWTTDDRRSNG
jgi:predicted transcriptional regulator